MRERQTLALMARKVERDIRLRVAPVELSGTVGRISANGTIEFLGPSNKFGGSHIFIAVPLAGRRNEMAVLGVI